MENIVKPLTVAREDFINALVQLINSSGLPLCIVEYVLRDTINEVHTTGMRQVQEDRDKYEQAVKKQQTDNTQKKTKSSQS